MTESAIGKNERMTLDVNSNGKIFIRNITDEAMEYITARRNEEQRAGWLFAKDPKFGNLLVTVSKIEPKDSIVEILRRLIDDYRLEVSPAAEWIFASWEAEKETSERSREQRKEIWRLEEQIRELKIILECGCRGCSDLSIEPCGDDADGYCGYAGHKKLYDVMEYPFQSSKSFMERKYFPCEGCKYLKN